MIQPLRTSILLLLAAILPGLAAPPSAPGPGWTLVHETRVRLEGTILLRRAGAPADEQRLRLALAPGRPVPVAFSLGERDPVRVGLVVTAQVPGTDGPIRIHLEADVQPAGTSPTTTVRDLALDPGRAGLVELWADGDGRQRLVLACSATVEEIPRLERVTPETRPVDLLVEVVGGKEGSGGLLHRIRLATLVGTPARYSLAAVPGSAPGSPEAGLRVELELFPVRVREGLVELRARVALFRSGTRGGDEQDDDPGKDEGGGSEPVAEASASDRLPPGGSLEIPLPRRTGSEPVTFRVTVFF